MAAERTDVLAGRGKKSGRQSPQAPAAPAPAARERKAAHRRPAGWTWRRSCRACPAVPEWAEQRARDRDCNRRRAPAGSARGHEARPPIRTSPKWRSNSRLTLRRPSKSDEAALPPEAKHNEARATGRDVRTEVVPSAKPGAMRPFKTDEARADNYGQANGRAGNTGHRRRGSARESTQGSPRNDAKPAQPGNRFYDSLEQEMASLLGRPATSAPRGAPPSPPALQPPPRVESRSSVMIVHSIGSRRRPEGASKNHRRKDTADNGRARCAVAIQRRHRNENSPQQRKGCSGGLWHRQRTTLPF